MHSVIYKKGAVGGEVNIPPSKSVAHRAMICAALSDGSCTLNNIDYSNDMIATMNFIKALGKQIDYDKNDKTLKISTGQVPKTAEVDCKAIVDCMESGSTLRFIIPVMAALGITTTFTGEGRLPQRPIGVYNELFKGVNTKSISENGDGLPFFINGQLESGEYHMRGDISSQFISGMLFALPLLKGDSKIIITTKLESKSYIDITTDVMATFGVKVEETDYGYFVKGEQAYKAVDYTVEADWSQVAFFIAMGAFSEGEITLNGLNFNSKQGDKKIVDVLKSMGVCCEEIGDKLKVSKPKNGLNAVKIDVSDIPDTVPTLACVMAMAQGTSEIVNAARLRIKESDRLSAISNALNALGANVKELEDGLIINGVKKLTGASVDGCNDHRIVMAMAVLRSVCSADIQVSDAYSINKSYPSFYKDYNSLGGVADVIDMG